ncbi:type II toxin-antitoxin system RelE/ParE family toxin [Caulobacter soli]|uniref:type II toxin-antitoxin system RelE/ParE family toxin n=1 Tax=Caulobacter soli TaxID=2708539 RepID=UPI0013EB37D6|nr:type II toxin-antitoxin system RelE/ParE family toxin [Caulobacter soli]
MKRVRLSGEARRDLDDIWTYSRDQWGARRAAAYLRDIRAAFTLIAERPAINPVLNGLDEGYRKRLVGSHVIFYRLEAGHIEIDRVMHQSEDATLRFGGD